MKEIAFLVRDAVRLLSDIANTLTLIGVFMLGSCAYHECSTPAHADPQPALDRQLVERMVRALEAQARATEKLAEHNR